MGFDFEGYKTWVMSRVNLKNSVICDTLPGTKAGALLALGAMGLAGETGEVVDLLKKVIFHGKPLTEELRAKLILEMGDVLWYFALLAKLVDVPLETIIERNVVKLVERDGVHGEKFKEARV